MLFDIEATIKTAGYVGLFGIVFAETGLFVGFFLPGDSLLFTAGILASQGYLNIALVCLALFAGAVAGNATGYLFGKHVGKRFFHREDSILFHRKHLDTAHDFYEKHGGKTILLARFIPIVRTFAPIVAGISELPFGTFLTYSTIGGALWAIGLPLAGYFLGRLIPNVDRYLLPIIGLIVIISIAPAIKEILGSKERRQNVLNTLRSYKKK